MANNAYALMNTLEDEPEKDHSPLLRERMVQLGEIIEALKHIASSNYWKVLRQYEFDNTLHSLLVELGEEKDSVKIFRLQGEIRRAKKYDLDKLLTERLGELERIRKQLNGK